MNQRLFIALLNKTMLLALVVERAANQVEVVILPVGTSSFRSLDVIVGPFLRIVQFQIAIRNYIILAQALCLDSFTSCSL